jgi:hypothetical protein
MTMKKTFKTTIVRDGSLCLIPLPFDPKPVFGKVRAPVKVTLNGYTFRSTIASMGDGPCLPLRRSNREAARLDGNETLSVTLELDEQKREVKAPSDLLKALKAVPGAHDAWRRLSFTHQREHVEAIEQAKKPETRARRLERAVAMVGGSAANEPRMNKAWHESHPMPKKPTLTQRKGWHEQHQKHCGCRLGPRIAAEP